MEEVEDEEEVEETVPNWAKSSKLADLLTWTCLLMLQFSSRLDFWSLQKTRLPFSSSLLLLLLTPSPLFLVLSGQHSFVKAIAATFRLSSSQGNNYFVFVSFFWLFPRFVFFSLFFFFCKKDFWKRECGMSLVWVYYGGKSQNVLEIVFLDTKQHISCLGDARKWTTPSYYILYTYYNMFIYAFACQ